MNDTLWGIRCVWLRYFDVFRKDLLYALVTTFTEPLLYIVSFGYGMGSLIGEIHLGSHTLTYRQYVLAGIIAQSILFQSFFEASYGSFVRMYYHKIFKAMALTPVTLSEVLWGELLWDASRATLSATVVLGIGCLTGDFAWKGALLAIPLCFMGGLIFSSLGLAVAAFSKTIEQISYPQFLLINPMFLYCGIYFPLKQLPEALQWIAVCLPLTALVDILRSFTLGLDFPIYAPINLGLWLVVLLPLARTKMHRRLIR